MNLETLDYQNNRGEITGSVEDVFHFNDTPKNITIYFNNRTKNKRNDIRISSVDMDGVDFFALPFTDNDDWASYEAEIEEAIAALEAKKEPEFDGHGYNGSDVR